MKVGGVSGRRGVSFSIWPDGIGGRRSSIFAGHAETWPEAIASLEAKWAEVEEAHNETLVQAMAEAVMHLTFQHGQCTEGSLRATFSQSDIDRFGAAASARANAVADRGPFEIVKDGPGNSPPEDTEAEAV